MSKLIKLIYGVSTISGTIIGVGFFALPYITSKVGTFVMLGYFLVLGILVLAMHLIYGELALRAPDFKRLPGFAQFYLGLSGKRIALAAAIFGMFGSILAYLIVGSEFLTELLSPIFGGGSLIYTFLYFAAAAILIFGGMKIISKIEFWGMGLFFLILTAVFVKLAPEIKMTNIFIPSDFSQLFLPFGPILFSLGGASLIPDVEEMLGQDKQLLKKIIIIATLIPAIFYLLFIYFILGVTGTGTSESALVGLKNVLGDGAISLTLILGVLTTFTSFIAIGMTLKKIFWYDLKIEKNLSWAITCFLPLVLFLLGVKKFIPVISFVGGITLGVEGVIILLMYKKIKPKSVIIYPLALVFLVGIIYQIIYFTK